MVLINVITRTQSTWLQSSELSTSIPLSAILLAIDFNKKLLMINAKSNRHDSEPVYQNKERLLSHSKQYRNSLYQLMYLRFICYKLKLMDVITISTLLSISHN